MPGLVKSRVYVNAVDDVLEEPLPGAQPHFVADVATVRADEGEAGDAAGAGWVVGLGAAWIGLLRAGTLVRGGTGARGMATAQSAIPCGLRRFYPRDRQRKCSGRC